MADFTPAYTADDKAKVAIIVAWLAADANRTGADLSRLTQVKEGTRSSILNGSYLSSPTKFLDRLLGAIERTTERDDDKADIPFTMTGIATNIIQTCYRTQKDRDFGIFVGSVGIGKTTALREYCQQHPEAVLVEAFDGIDHGVFISELTTAMRLPRNTGSLSAQTAYLINSLRDSDRVILVDEANHLSPRSLGALRRISDVGRIGVVLVGTAELSNMVNDPNGRFGQISSRIGFWNPIAMTIEEEDAIALISSYFDATPPETVVKAFWDCCEGSARMLRNLLRNTWRKSMIRKTAITAELVIQTSREAMAGHIKVPMMKANKG